MTQNEKEEECLEEGHLASPLSFGLVLSTFKAFYSLHLFPRRPDPSISSLFPSLTAVSTPAWPVLRFVGHPFFLCLDGIREGFETDYSVSF